MSCGVTRGDLELPSPPASPPSTVPSWPTSTHFSESPAQHSPWNQPGNTGAGSRGKSQRLPPALHGRRHLGPSRAALTTSAGIGRVPGCGNDLRTRLARAPAPGGGDRRQGDCGRGRIGSPPDWGPWPRDCKLLVQLRAPCLFPFCP